MISFCVFFVVVLVLCDISPWWLCLCSALVWYLSTKVHSCFSVFVCLFWVVEWCKRFRFDARNFLPPVILLLRKKKTSSVESRGRHLPWDSTEKAFFRSGNVKCGRQLLPWSLAKNVFREIPRKKQSSAIVMSIAEEAVFQSWHYNCGRILLPWNLPKNVFRDTPRMKVSSAVDITTTEDVFRETPRKKVSSTVDITTAEDCFFRGISRKTLSARLHGRSCLPQLSLQLRKNTSSMESRKKCLPRDSKDEVFSSAVVMSSVEENFLCRIWNTYTILLPKINNHTQKSYVP